MKPKGQVSPPTYLFLCLILALTLHFLFPTTYILSNLRLLGVTFILAGLAINILADNLFKKEKTTVKPNEIPSKLITSGPFAISRHPMYLGFVILLFGVSLTLGSASSFIAPIAMFIILEKKLIPFEEGQMQKHFGKKYLEYKSQVRRWL